ncbi:MAG: PAS domain S-box protein [Candidatus Lindowbacteria bacterium]|nr:PAS domain S-box protein [Candidatus Lindowbacteria bacterium]
MASPNLSAKLFWAKAEYLGIVTVPAAWLLLVFLHAGKEQWLRPRYLALLTIEPLLMLLMVGTNDFHHFVWNNVQLDTAGSFSILTHTYGIGFWIHSIYSYSLFFLGISLIIGSFTRSPHIYRKQAVMILVASLAPFAGNVIYISGLSPFPHLDLTPFAFCITCLAFTWGLSRFRLLDMVPVARDAVVEGMRDAVVVLDAAYNIVDMNPATERLLEQSVSRVIGKPIAEVWACWPGELERSDGITDNNHEIVFDDAEKRRVYDMRISHQSDAKGRPSCKVVMLRYVTEHKSAEDVLKASEANYKAIFDTVNDAIFVHDIETGEILDVNQKMCEMYGYSAEEARRLNVEALSSGEPPYTQRDALCWLEKAAQGAPQLFEWRAKDRGGRLFWVEVSLKRAAIGGVDRLLAIVRDVTERKRTQEALQESDRRYRLLAQNVTDVIWTMELQTMRFTFVSPSVMRLRGYRPTEVMAQPLDEVLAPDSLEVAAKSLQEELLREEASPKGISRSRTIELEQLCKDGSTVWTEVTVTFLRDPDGKPVELLGVTRDIAERKRAEEALRRSEEKYRLHYQNVSDCIYSLDKEFRLTSVSPSVETLLGYRPEEMLGRPFHELNIVAPEYLEQAAADAAHILSGGRIASTKYEFIARDGARRLGDISGAPLYDEGGKIIGVISVARDITQQKQLEQQLLHAQKMESIGTLAGGIAHDFNNLLAGILGYASLTKTKISNKNDIFRYVDTIEKSAIRAADLASQLLAFARGGKYDSRPVDLNSVIDETLKIIARTFEKSIEIETSFLASLPTVEADAGQLQQVLMNLCVNARDAMPDGGKLIIETNVSSLTVEYAMTHAGSQPGSYVCFSVTDTGVGMDEKTMQRIFEPFFTTKPQGKGTGLGLAMVYGVVRNHGGFVSVHSEPCKGSIFRVYLPVNGKPETKDLPLEDRYSNPIGATCSPPRPA